MNLYAALFLLGVSLGRVTASIYPTQPVQATVWSADQPMLVSWIEDGKQPLLSGMGPVDISLWDAETYLVALASGVDPTQKTCQVTVPTWVLGRGKYSLRFTTSKPVDTVIYSADFAIVPANGTTAARTVTSGAVALATQSGSSTDTGSTGTGNGTTSTGSGTGSGFRTVVTTTGSLSSLTTTTMTTTTNTTTTTSAPTPSSSIRSTTPSGVPPPSGTLPQGQTQRASSAARRGVDVEKLKFQFVFVIWPVLMGITMAL